MYNKVVENEQILIFHGDAFDVIKDIPENTIQTTITSPTYWGKRQFSDDPREFGTENLEQYIDRNVSLYSHILEKTKDDGSLFIIIQDSYMGSGISRTHHMHHKSELTKRYKRDGTDSNKHGNTSSVTSKHSIIQNKSLCGTPFRIAISLVDMGYIWRELIIWEKPNPMPSNVKDRVRQSSEYILHFTKSGKYKFNPEPFQIKGKSGKMRMMNQVWNIPNRPKKGHTATFSHTITERLLLATSDIEDIVFEPFLGYGTMYDLTKVHNRRLIACDISGDIIKKFMNRVNELPGIFEII